jgi:NAD(P)H-dependent FMN reductase
MITPGYNHSTSGVFKNTPDHLYADWKRTGHAE